MDIKVLGSDCANCKTTLRLIEEVAAEKGLPINLDKVEDLQAIMGYGVMSTPGVVIDGKVVHAGGVLFSGAEIAFVSSNKLKIELDRKQGLWSGRILTFFVRNTSTLISALLLGNNVALVVYGIFMASLLDPVIRQFTQGPALILVMQTVVSTLIVLVTGEFLPKAFFRVNPNHKMKQAAFPLLITYIILYIPTIFTIGLSRLFLSLFGVSTQFSQQPFSRVDLDHYVRDIDDRTAAKSEMDNEIQILKNELEFSKIKARDCLIPRTEIEAVNVDEDIAVLRKRFIDTGYSKIVIYRESIDNIIGYVHAFELFHRPQLIKEILLPVFIVPEAIPI